MEHNAALEEMRQFTVRLETERADINTTLLAQHVLAVLDAFEERLDTLDNREGA